MIIMLVNSAVLLHSEHCRRGTVLHHWHKTLNDTTVCRYMYKCFAHLIRYLASIEEVQFDATSLYFQVS